MWKLLRSEAELKTYVDYLLSTDDGYTLSLEYDEPEDFPCAVRPTFIGDLVVSLVFFYAEDARRMISMVDNDN